MSYGPEVVLDQPAYIHPTVHLYGKIKIGQGASFWINAAARAEFHEIVVGPYTNIQDFTMIHVGDSTPTIIGSHCSITHHCTLHGCTIGDNVLVGINSTVADGAVVGNNVVIGQHTFVRENQVIPDNSIAVGSPAKVIRTQNNYVRNRINALMYYKNALAYARGDHRYWADPALMKEIGDEIARLTREVQAQSGD